MARLQAEYVLIYGGPDDSPTSAGQFEPPAGAFCLGYDGDTPAAMGGWRLREDGRSELKRMYVPDEHRGRGFSRAVLLWLEDSALSAGATEVVLETNQLRPLGHELAPTDQSQRRGLTGAPSSRVSKCR